MDIASFAIIALIVMFVIFSVLYFKVRKERDIAFSDAAKMQKALNDLELLHNEVIDDYVELKKEFDKLVKDFKKLKDLIK